MAEILRFNANITAESLIASARLHNQFPPDTSFPQVDVRSDGFEELCAIIAKYKVQNHFRLRLLHRHLTIPEGQILLGTSTTKRSGYWTTPMRISDVDLQNIHGHIFSLDPASCASSSEMRTGLLYPSEFREGPPVSVATIDGNFFTDFTDCLRTKGLGSTLGLEVIQGRAGRMVEFSFDTGSLLLQETEVRPHFESQETGWTITVKDGVVDKDGETRCVILQGQHLKATSVQVKSMLEALKILGDEGVLVQKG